MPEKQKPISIDMTQARLMEPLSVENAYLCAVNAWKPGIAGSGGKKLHYELTVVRPEEFAKRRLIEDLSLENEFTLGRLFTLLKGLGFAEEDIKKTDFVLPDEEAMLGLQCTVWVRTESSEEFGDRSRIRRIRPSESFSEAAL